MTSAGAATIAPPRQLVLAERLLQAAQRVAQLVLAEELAQARAVGLARDLLVEVEADLEIALDGRQALGDARVLGVVEQVLFALGPADRRGCAPSTPSSVP